MELSAFIADYVANNDRVRSAETIRVLNVAGRNLSAHLGRPATTKDLADASVRAYLKARREAGKSLATIDGEAAKLLALAKYGALRGLCPAPQLKLPKSPTPLPVAFTRQQLQKLWRAAHACETTIGGVAGRVYWPALLDVLWDSGERIRAIYCLERGDIDLDNRWVTFRNRKGNGRPMVKSVRRPTAKHVRALMQAHSAPTLFGVACLGTIYHQFEHLLADAGLPIDRHSKFHCIRKSHASYLHLAGGDARASLGHSSDAVTVRHYIDPRIASGKQPIKLLFNPLGTWGWIRRLLLG